MLAQVEDEARREAMIGQDLEIKAREEADRRARRILATAIQRLSEVVTETTVSVVQLPSDDMKGRSSVVRDATFDISSQSPGPA